MRIELADRVRPVGGRMVAIRTPVMRVWRGAVDAAVEPGGNRSGSSLLLHPDNETTHDTAISVAARVNHEDRRVDTSDMSASCSWPHVGVNPGRAYRPDQRRPSSGSGSGDAGAACIRGGRAAAGSVAAGWA